MLNHRLTVGLAALSLLAGCGADDPAPSAPPPTPPSTPAADFACESGARVAVEYPDARTARVTYRGQAQVLASLQVASGARYVGRTLEWWTAVRDGRETGVLRSVPENAETEGQVLERCSRAAPDVAAAVSPTPVDPAPATPARPVSSPCRTDQLSVGREGGDAGMGSRGVEVALLNTSAQPCSVTGFAGVILVDARGRDVTSVRVDKMPGAFGETTEPTSGVELAPGSRAVFDLVWSVVPDESAGQKTCPATTRLKVTPPGALAPLVLDHEMTPCGARVRISPLRAADTKPTARPSVPA